MILLEIIEHLSDADSERIPRLLARQEQLKPNTSQWLKNWSSLLENPSFSDSSRPLTRHATFVALKSVFVTVHDLPTYRSPLIEKVFRFWTNIMQKGDEGVDGEIIWHILSEEIRLHIMERDELQQTEGTNANVDEIISAMFTVSTYCDCNGELEIRQSSPAMDSNLSYQVLANTVLPTSGSPFLPLLPRMASDISLNSTPASARFRPCRGLSASIALIDVFTSLSFDGNSTSERDSPLSIHVFGKLRQLLRTAKCPRVRIAILQMLLRLRADRDHRVYLLREPEEQHVLKLARQVGRVRDPMRTSAVDDARMDDAAVERARTMQRHGRRLSRGRGSRTSGTESRSRSRVPGSAYIGSMTPVNIRPRDQLWMLPDIVAFSQDNSDKESHGIVTYDSRGQSENSVLPVSAYMDELVEIIKAERDWEILSYVLVHLPAQLANKHFWCGPRARVSISNLLLSICRSIANDTLGKYIPQEEWPGTFKARDAVGLAYHTLTILISYQQIFDNNKRMDLVKVLQDGLSGRGESVIICTHALILCLFEMETAMIKMLPSILPKLAQIVTNPSMAVHILTFLCILNSRSAIHANFTSDDFKVVFHIALQYLQHHNRRETIEEIQFSLGQHVRIMCYSVLYMWFLTLKLEDRPHHVEHIVRQLCSANTEEGSDDCTNVDEPTEVCFDFLARYTYANADPKPAPSLLGDILSTPDDPSDSEAVKEKSWVIGYSVVTVKLLAKPGWMEIIIRRASGTTKFFCRSENVPLVGLGDLNPDMVTIPAVLMTDKYKHTLDSIYTQQEVKSS